MSKSILTFFTCIALLMGLASCSKVTVETADNFDGVELPDGSMVYLNYNSSLTYDKEFAPRHVEIEGEFYFKVVKGNSPFIIKTDLGEVKVIGTKFSVKTDNDELEVEVEEGSVELDANQTKHKLKRGERALYKKGESEIKKLQANYKSQAWMKDLKVEFKKLGKEFKKGTKEIGKESEKAGKEIKKEIKKLKIN